MKELQNLNSSNNNKILVVLPLNKVEDYLLNECLYSLAQQEYPIDLLILANNLSQEQKDIILSMEYIVMAAGDEDVIQRAERINRKMHSPKHCDRSSLLCHLQRLQCPTNR